MSNIFSRLGRTIVGAANTLVGKIEDPVASAKVIVEQMDERIQTANQALVRTMARRKIVKADLDTANAEVSKWSDNVRKANDKGQAELVQQCLAKVKSAKSQADMFQSQLNELNAAIAGTEKQIQEAEHNRANALNGVQIMESQMFTAEAKMAAVEASSATNVSELSGEMARLQDSIRVRTANADAAIELAQNKTGQDLENQMAALDTDSDDALLNSILGKAA